jgi:hypothetical protein
VFVVLLAEPPRSPAVWRAIGGAVGAAGLGALELWLAELPLFVELLLPEPPAGGGFAPVLPPLLFDIAFFVTVVAIVRATAYVSIPGSPPLPSPSPVRAGFSPILLM